MKKRMMSLLLALSLTCSLLCISASAELPKGWWPVWEAYEKAADGGADDATLLEKGDAVIAFYSKYDRTDEIANQLFVVYRDRLERLIYENRGEWDKAIANTKALEELCRYQIGINNSPDTYREWLPTCAAHLSVLEPFTGVYAASYTQSKTYGSKYAASSGTFYGTPHEGVYGDGSIVSFYVDVEEGSIPPYILEMLKQRDDGARVLLLNLNFKGEGSTARSVPSGTYDSSLRAILGDLATLSGPVLLRIAAEPNVWEDTVTPSDFIAAYNYVARMARSTAPKAELVWSPNCASGWNVNTADFYPDNSLVDWVGMSLYYNYTNPGGSKLDWLEYIRAGRFADPVGNAAQVVDIARGKGKPVIATEGGTVEYGGVANYKASQIAKEFSTLTMVYPEVKAIVYFDKTFNGNDYRLAGAAKSAADAAIAANPTLIAAGARSAATYVPLTQFNEKVDGALILGATGRTYNNMDMSAVWTLDGKQIASASGSPNQCRIDAAALGSGSHKLEVTLSDGKGYSIAKAYTLTSSGGTVKASEGFTESAPKSEENAPSVTVNGSAVQWTDAKPFIDANNRTMVPLRAVGDALGLTVKWDGEKREASFSGSGKTIFFPIDSANARTGDGQEIKMDTAAVIVSDRTYAPVRYLAEYFGRSVGWDGATHTVVIK